ncbi:MAG: S1 family peptidase [Verrucomicrobia subdivision 3 bacterium]|nr:S1 family peptidase [Limisphaerales bacterium]
MNHSVIATMKTFLRRIFQLAVALPVLAGAALFAAPGGLTLANPRVQEAMAVQRTVTSDLLALEGILGTAVGEDDGGEVAMIVFVSTEGANPGEVMRALPVAIRGVRVAGRLTDPFRALAGRPIKASHTAKQTPPIQLGSSGGWSFDLANGYCCGGTLGGLISINGVQHILSNYHVLESDIALGGNGRVKQNGDPVIQPGLIDVGCVSASAQPVATLVVRNALPGFNVDAAIAQVVPGMVDPSGAILGIGTLSSQTAQAFINQGVKKSGRTSGLTRSRVAALNAMVSVAYENECAGGSAFTKTFTGQVVVSNQLAKGKKFLAGGDSGSVLVEDVTTSPRAVGLLFAGSTSYAIANPIDEVLAFFGATMVGQ